MYIARKHKITGEVGALANDLESTARTMDLDIVRFRTPFLTEYGNKQPKITWATYNPNHVTRLDLEELPEEGEHHIQVHLFDAEGKTEACEAFRKINLLRNWVNEYGQHRNENEL